MNRAIILLTVAITILAIPVFSATCTDSDEGPIDPSYPKEFISKPGNTSVAKTMLTDYCMHEKNGVKTGEGEWIKEYMCIGNLAIGKDYKCSNYGYQKCISDKGLAACVTTGKTTVTAPKPVTTAQNTTTPKKPKVKLPPQCGDKQIQQERGEQCDPPGRLCVDADGYAGMCEKDCKCKAYKKGELPLPEQIKPAEEAKPETETNTSVKVKSEETVKEKRTEERKEQKPEEDLPENAGFFARVLNWLSKTFS